jgi:hypothetical protein
LIRTYQDLPNDGVDTKFCGCFQDLLAALDVDLAYSRFVNRKNFKKITPLPGPRTPKGSAKKIHDRDELSKISEQLAGNEHRGAGHWDLDAVYENIITDIAGHHFVELFAECNTILWSETSIKQGHDGLL